MSNTEFKLTLGINVIVIVLLIVLGMSGEAKEETRQPEPQATKKAVQMEQVNREIVSVGPEIIKPAVEKTDRVEATATPKPTKKPKKAKKLKVKKARKDIRTFKITAYCPCYNCSGSYGRTTATGTQAKEGRTVAVDPKVIPYGTHLIIDDKEYVAEDCGGAVKGNKIDMFMENHSAALEWGVKYLNVEILANK